MMAIPASVVHQMPGRIRLRIPDKRRDRPYFRDLQKKIEGIDAVERSKLNADTGSVLLEFSCPPEELMRRLREHGLEAELKQDGGVPARAARPLPAGMPVRLVTGRRIGPMFMLGTAMAGIGVVQLFRGRLLVPSVSAFWYAAQAFRFSGKRK